MRVAWTTKTDNRPRPARMKKPKVTSAAHRVYKEYIQDLLHDILVDKYGTKRGTDNFEYFVNKGGGAFYAVGQAIQDEKAQMFLDLGENPPTDYWKESYLDVWKRWMARPITAKMDSSMSSRFEKLASNVERSFLAKKDMNVPPDFVGDPKDHGIESPRGGGFSIMQNLQKDLHEESYEESGVKPPKTGSHHCERMTCSSCGSVQTCRCKAAKIDSVGICYDCQQLASGNPGMFTAAVKEAMYWCSPGRTYRMTKSEQDSGISICPKCKEAMETESFTRSEKLHRCPGCGFKVPSGSVTTQRLEPEIEITAAGVRVDRSLLKDVEKVLKSLNTKPVTGWYVSEDGGNILLEHENNAFHDWAGNGTRIGPLFKIQENILKALNSKLKMYSFSEAYDFGEDGELRIKVSSKRKASSKSYVLSRDVKTKKGEELKRGEKLRVASWSNSYPYTLELLRDDGSRLVLRVSNASRFLDRFPKEPSIRTMEKWSMDGVAKAVDGSRVEPDGFSHDGAPSWLLVVGVI